MVFYCKLNYGNIPGYVGVARRQGGLDPLEFAILYFPKRRLFSYWFRAGKIKFHHGWPQFRSGQTLGTLKVLTGGP